MTRFVTHASVDAPKKITGGFSGILPPRGAGTAVLKEKSCGTRHSVASLGLYCTAGVALLADAVAAAFGTLR